MSTSSVKAICLVLALSVPAIATPQGTSPEDAIQKFLASAKELDLDGMMRCFAVDGYADGYDVRGIALEVGMLNLRNGLPKEYPVYRKANRYVRQAVAANAGAGFLIALSGSRRDWRGGVRIQDAAEVDKLIREINPERAKKLQVLYVRDATPATLRTNAELKTNFAQQAKQMGASGKVERVALVKVENELLAVPFRMLKYPSGWQIESTGSDMGGLWGVTPMAEKEFLARFPE